MSRNQTAAHRISSDSSLDSASSEMSDLSDGSELSAVSSSLLSIATLDSQSRASDGGRGDESQASSQHPRTAQGEPPLSHANSKLASSRLSVASATPQPVSVVLRFDLSDFSFLDVTPERPASAEFACHEPADVGGALLFELRVSNGWKARYALSSGALSATSPQGSVIEHRIRDVRQPVTAPAPRSDPSDRLDPQASSLVRLCQWLAMRSLELRPHALRLESSRWPMIHFDTLPTALLESFRTSPARIDAELRDELRGTAKSTSNLGQDALIAEVSIRGVGRGHIDADGNLCVVFTDGARMTLAASGLQLRYRPPWDPQREDTFELLTSSNTSAFLPSLVTRQLETIPEFIRRLKGQRDTATVTQRA